MRRTLLVAAAPLDPSRLLPLLISTLVLILGSGLLVLIFRVVLEGSSWSKLRSGEGGTTVVRSWLAVALVAGLLLFAATSFVVDGSELRNLLMGGVVAAGGTAAAFYFASKSAEQTQRNLLDAR